MRESWTDERLDYFRAETGQRFDAVDKRFDAIDKRFDRVEDELHRLNDRVDGLQRTMVHAAVAMTAAILAGFGGLAGLLATAL